MNYGRKGMKKKKISRDEEWRDQRQVRRTKDKAGKEE